jgi:hypothetical protein
VEETTHGVVLRVRAKQETLHGLENHIRELQAVRVPGIRAHNSQPLFGY